MQKTAAVKGEPHMTDTISAVIQALNRVVWGAPALLLILGVGLYFSLRHPVSPGAEAGLFSRYHLAQAAGEAGGGGVSPFQAVCTALAATVGTGNIAGVAGAIAIGGPGAIFWMWVAALLGMVVKYAEVVLAVRYREPDGQGSFRGGPMYYIKNGLGKKWTWLGGLFCAFGMVAAFGVGNSTQISTAVTSINEALIFLGLTPSPLGNLMVGLLAALWWPW